MNESRSSHRVRVPGSKSISNRALICAALAGSGSVIGNYAPGDDTEALITSLRDLGVGIKLQGLSASIDGQLDLSNLRQVKLNAQLGGTTSRFLTALCALRAGVSTIDGLEPLRKRPMIELHQTLQQLGANISWLGQKGCLPVSVSRGASWGARLSVDASLSSQFTSSLMMIAPYMTNGLEIDLAENVVSRGYIEMTVGVMRAFGAETDFSDNKIWVSPGKYSGTSYQVEPDASSASYPLAAVAINGGEVTIENLSRMSLQGDVGFIDILAEMGCQISETTNGLRLSRDIGKTLIGVDVDMSQISDCVPTLAVVALFASKPTRIKGVGFIRSKESDRIGDLVFELKKLGADISETPDGILIKPAPLKPAALNTHDDHRLAMAFALIQREMPGIVINNPEIVSKSWPGYFSDLASFYAP